MKTIEKPKRKYTRKVMGPKLTNTTVTTIGGPPVEIAAPKAIIPPLNPDIITKLLLHGDLSGLSPQETTEYYLKFCQHLGLDPVTRPFDILVLSGKKVLYAHKGCTDQLRKKYGVSVTDVRGEMIGDCYRVTAIGHDHTGRADAATGVVKVSGLSGDNFANAVMKAETKAKRRFTLSLCGLGMLDETELETIPGATTVSIDVTSAPTNGGAPKPEPVFDVGPARNTPDEPKGSWQEVGKAPQSYWSNKGNKEAQQIALISAFGQGKYKVERNAEDKWVAWREVTDPVIPDKVWSPEVEDK